MSPPRLAVLWCPQWPVVAAGAALDEPVAVLHANRVIARSTAAAAGGVRLGLRRREAQARCPEVRLVVHDPLVDHRAFQPVADTVARFVPRLELHRAGMLTFHTRGRRATSAATGRWPNVSSPRSTRRSATPCVRPVHRGSASPTVVSPPRSRRSRRRGRGGARSPARVLVVDPDASPSFLAPLPLRWLLDAGEVTTDLVELVARLGVGSLGEFAALPAADVLARFGRPGAAAWHMAAGSDDRPVGTEDPPAGLAAVQHFDSPVQHLEAVVFSGRHLAEQIVEALAATGRVCTQFVSIAETDHGETSERLWSLSTGFTATAMVERIRWQLDGWARLDAAALERAQDPDDPDPDLDPLAAAGIPTTGIIQLRIEPTEVRPDEGVQLGLWGGRSQADDWAQRAATRLAGLVGDEQVVVAEWRGGRHPSDVHRWVPASLSTRLDPGARPTGREPGRSRRHAVRRGPVGCRCRRRRRCTTTRWRCAWSTGGAVRSR